MNQNNFFEWLPQEITVYIFSQLDIQSLCRASMTCMSWFATIRDNESLWKSHCLAVRAVCKREVDDDQKSGYSWKVSLIFVVYSILNYMVVGVNQILFST